MTDTLLRHIKLRKRVNMHSAVIAWELFQKANTEIYGAPLTMDKPAFLMWKPRSLLMFSNLLNFPRNKLTMLHAFIRWRKGLPGFSVKADMHSEWTNNYAKKEKVSHFIQLPTTTWKDIKYLTFIKTLKKMNGYWQTKVFPS